MVTETALSRNANNIVVGLILGLLVWIGKAQWDAMDMMAKLDKSIAVQAEQISALRDLKQEVVPREENQRRWDATEKASALNSERISRIETYIYQHK